MLLPRVKKNVRCALERRMRGRPHASRSTASGIRAILGGLPQEFHSGQGWSAEMCLANTKLTSMVVKSLLKGSERWGRMVVRPDQGDTF
jgi:hypothetical protein